ncbi:hypothetical protein, partial [Acinetobacter sp. 1125_18A]|uniref:hypothetical protein n=1 Tax=Acinetobacter sp. 1125_18A TaxID=2605959 RepID=UPI004058DB97
HWDPTENSYSFCKQTAGYTTYYIQKGTVIFKNEETQEQVTIGPGGIIKLPKGDYQCKIISEIPLEFIQVLEWPAGWPKK